MFKLRTTFILLYIFSVTLVQTAPGQKEPTPDWQRIESLRTKELRGQISADESKELYEFLANLDVKKYPQEATKLALTTAGMAGDGGGSFVRVSAREIPESIAPVTQIESVKIDEHRALRISYRKPPGSGPFPAILFIHGGLKEQSIDQLNRQLRTNPVYTRLLAAGYVTIATTFRSYDRNNLQAPGPLKDVLTVFESLKGLEFVDSESIAVFGGSGGGSMAFDLAAQVEPAAIVAGEPATILFSGMLTTGEYAPRLKMMGDPASNYLPKHAEITRNKIQKITCPIMILHGDIHPLKIMNHEIFIPALKAAGHDPLIKVYPRQGHGFYFGSGTTQKVVEEVVGDVLKFLEQELPVRPQPF